MFKGLINLAGDILTVALARVLTRKPKTTLGVEKELYRRADDVQQSEWEQKQKGPVKVKP